MKKFEHGRLSGRGGYAPARRDRAPFPSQRLNVDVSLRHYFFSFLLFSFPPPIPFPRSPSPVEIPRGAHSIIRYLCRTRHKSNPWQEKRPSTGQETLTPFLFLLSLFPLPSPNRCFAETHVANLATHFPIFPSRNAIPIPTRFRLNIYCPLGLINDTFLAFCALNVGKREQERRIV